jgi:hypothetical protein
VWFRWHGRDLGSAVKIISRCDVAPWNIDAKLHDGFVTRLIEFAVCDTACEADDAALSNRQSHEDRREPKRSR